MVERCPDKTEVEGPIPSVPTKIFIMGSVSLCALSSVVERFIDIEKVGSSILPGRTMYIVYVIVNRENKIYIGQTNNLERRLLEHNFMKAFLKRFYQEWSGRA